MDRRIYYVAAKMFLSLLDAPEVEEIRKCILIRARAGKRRPNAMTKQGLVLKAIATPDSEISCVEAYSEEVHSIMERVCTPAEFMRFRNLLEGDDDSHCDSLDNADEFGEI